MKTPFRILLLILILLVGYFAVHKEFNGNETGLFYEFNYIPFVLLIFLTIAALISDISFYKQHKSKAQFISLAIGCLLCCTIVFKINKRHKIDNSKLLYTFNGNPYAEDFLSIDLLENNNFKLNNIDLFNHIVYYGTYTKKGDTITLIDVMNNPYLKQIPATGIIQQNKIHFKGLDTLEFVE